MNRLTFIAIAALVLPAGCWRMQLAGDGEVDDDSDDTSSAADADTDADTDTDTSFDVPPGHLLWAVSAGGDEDDVATGIAALTDGTIVVVGTLLDNAWFGQDEENATHVATDGPMDGFVARFGADGDLVWARGLGGDETDHAQEVVALGDDRFAVAGDFQGDALIGEDEDGPVWLESEGGSDAFLAVCDLGGDIVWVQRAGGPGTDVAQSVAGSLEHGLFVSGTFKQDIGFDQGGPGETGLTAEGAKDLFLARYGVDGGFSWARAVRVDSTTASCKLDNVRATDVALGPDGSAQLTGSLDGPVVFAPGEPEETVLESPSEAPGTDQHVFVGRHDHVGDLDWARVDGSAATDRARAVVQLDDGASLVTGMYSSFPPNQAAYFGLDEPGETELETFGGGDIFLVRYASEGTVDWAVRAGSMTFDSAYELAAWPDGSAAVTGAYRNFATFGPGEPGETLLKSSGGKRSVFLARYRDDGELEWVTRAGYDDESVGMSVAIDADGAILVTGYFAGTAVFGGGEENETELESNGEWDIFVAKYAP